MYMRNAWVAEKRQGAYKGSIPNPIFHASMFVQGLSCPPLTLQHYLLAAAPDSEVAGLEQGSRMYLWPLPHLVVPLCRVGVGG
jgi:hypothetical protein